MPNENAEELALAIWRSIEHQTVFRCVGGNWIAYRGRQAIWEAHSRRALLEKLEEMGIYDAQWRPLTIGVYR
jgi:hypothetical protein